ncbi:MAG: hypothetical protein RUMPE_01174 [Eubacteriales bacterium SKADARSKE-1]|nr:hypothetical protein [Eubacteriales bacterium SKADARSKE-1]
MEICKNLAKQDLRIKIIAKQNAGVSSARNKGLKLASGEFIQFVDADDYIDEMVCKRLFTSIKENAADVVICGYKKVNFKKLSYKKVSNKKTTNLVDFENDFGFLFENALFNPPWNKLYRKDKIKSMFDENVSIGEDLIFNLNYFSNIQKIVLVDFCPYNYVVSNEQSLSAKYNDNLFETQLILNDYVCKFCKKCFGQAYSKANVDRVFAKEIYYLLKKLVILDNASMTSKFHKIKNVITNERVKKMANGKDMLDSQIKIINFFIRHNRVFAIYVFFYFKKVVLSK